MPTVNYTLRVDENDKHGAEHVFKELGMTFATGINIYLKTVSRQKRIPFDLALNEQSGAATGQGVKATALPWEKERAFMALSGILAGHEVDLDKERAERIMAK
jgi:addiction module RelB/DinJ family antitoxin